MLTVHHLNNSRSQRVLWLLEELDVPYEIVRYARDPKTMLAPPELRAIHPLGKSPVVTDDGRTYAESGAIIEYLVERYGNGRRAAARHAGAARLHVLAALRGRVGDAAAAAQARRAANRARADAVLRPADRAQDRRHAAIELRRSADRPASRPCRRHVGPHRLVRRRRFQRSRHPDELSARSRDRPRGGSRYPAIARFLDAIHARPAYQRALERGGPYDLLATLRFTLACVSSAGPPRR